MNRVHLFFGIIIAAFILLVHVDSSAFMCGSQVVSVGEVKYRVIQLCGEPDYKEVVKSKTEGNFGSDTTTHRRSRAHWQYRSYIDGGSKQETVLIENWTYDCGANDFIYVLTFEGDKLIEINTKGRGSIFGDCSSARKIKNR
jgi:hypothetical protein